MSVLDSVLARQPGVPATISDLIAVLRSIDRHLSTIEKNSAPVPVFERLGPPVWRVLAAGAISNTAPPTPTVAECKLVITAYVMSGPGTAIVVAGIKLGSVSPFFASSFSGDSVPVMLTGAEIVVERGTPIGLDTSQMTASETVYAAICTREIRVQDGTV